MSLLEDLFLGDEADEAQALERVIEGDYDERPRSRSVSSDSENGNKDDEAEEDKRRVDPSSTKTKKVTKNPRFILNPARLTGPRGIQIIPDHFKDFKFKGKGHEKDDLDMVLKKLEHWAYRLYPKFQFDDCLKKIETLGRKRPVMVHLHKIRTDQFLSEETVVQKDSSDEETAPQEEDEFDKLLQQQIELARATPAPGSVKKVIDTPRLDRSPFTMPKATSSPSISDEQKERMIRNRKLAEERRLARLKKSMDNGDGNKSNFSNIEEEVEEVVTKKHVRCAVNSSDEECDVTAVNHSFTVDVHSNIQNDGDLNKRNVVETVGTDDLEVQNKKTDIETDNINNEGNNSEDKSLHDNVDNIEEETQENTTASAVNSAGSLKIPVVDSIMNNESIKDKNEISNIDITKENIIEKVSEDLTDNSETNVVSNKVDISVNQSNVDEGLPEDVMDVDFSDDF